MSMKGAVSAESGGLVIGWVPQPIGGMSMVQMGLFESFFNFCSHDSSPAGRKLFRGYAYANAGYIPISRNMVVQSFLEQTQADWLLMLDWDISFDPLAVYQLLDAADPVARPIISGVYVTYFGEGAALRPCWMEETADAEYSPVSSFEVGKVVPLSLVGMGFTLIHRTVFLKLQDAYATDPWKWFGHDIVGADRTGEDLTFCSRARAQGFSVWGHGGVLLGHTKAKMLTPLDMGDGPAGVACNTPPVAKPRRLLNVGGGSKAIPLPKEYDGLEHVLLDIAPGEGVDVVVDARTMAFDAEFDVVYCSHNLEHYYAHDVPTVLERFHAALKPGGVVCVRVPDIQLAMAQAADLDEPLYESSAGPVALLDMLYGFRPAIAESGEDHMAHRTGFSAESLRNALNAAGFDGTYVSSSNMELVAHAVRPL